MSQNTTGFGKPATGLVNSSVQKNTFNVFDREHKSFLLPDGFVAVPVWSIRKVNQIYTQEEEALTKLLSNDWNPKGSLESFPQRCPSIWVDNFTFLFKRGMNEPELLLGRWKKDVVVYGDKKNLEGLVVAGGGHYERCARKPIESQFHLVYEEGDMDLRLAADKELTEEIGIDCHNVLQTKELGYIDYVFNDPRYHGVRHVFLRWVDQEPTATSELSNIVSVPVSQMHYLYNREIPWTLPDGTKLGLILNHDIYVKLILHMQPVLDFIANIKESSANM
jgi:8-oxo-dGTP pyrophosphatase MutT (NUDIX family)